ncbi:unnamed protein product [Arabidopsis thaliana]|uniref:NAC domain-containing protein n=1 Tax=Arabidopsis thaliana TaxID=3702 RepID=A0A5S9S8Y2_ARATH|nr:unnamed protein product [Arabidopsis thaliana]
MVPGRGGSEGGTWTTTGLKKEIFSNTVVIGYKQEVSYCKHVKGQPKGEATGWCMTEYWLASENDAEFQEVALCNIRMKKNVLDQFKFPTENNNNLVEQPPLHNNMVSGSTMDQNMEEYADELENMLDEEEEEEDDRAIQQQPPEIPLQGHDSRSTLDKHMEEYADDLEKILDEEEEGDDDSAIQQQHLEIHLQLQDHGSRSTTDQNMEEYANELENILDEEEEEDDDDRGIQQQDSQIPLPVQSQDSGNPLVVIMEDERVDQDMIFDLVKQEEEERKLKTFSEICFAGLKTQRNLHFQDSYFAGGQEMSPWDNMVTNNNPFGLVFNTHGHEMQEPPVINGVNKDLSWYGAGQEQMIKRRKQC